MTVVAVDTQSLALRQPVSPKNALKRSKATTNATADKLRGKARGERVKILPHQHLSVLLTAAGAVHSPAQPGAVAVPSAPLRKQGFY